MTRRRPSPLRLGLFAAALLLCGFAVAAAVGSGEGSPPHAAPAKKSAVMTSALAAATPLQPVPATGRPRIGAGGIVLSAATERARQRAIRRNSRLHVAASTPEQYRPLYAEAQRAFGVNWLLLASIHRQETAFSQAKGTYHGRNFAGCCAGPMQFNISNGPVSTWELFRGAFRSARRPAGYPYETEHHPSIYDDFDAIAAAAYLLQDSGARMALDGTAWQAAYNYYGHDAFGVDYADQVVARAMQWTRSGFCANCAPDPAIVASLEAAYGGYARAQLEAEAKAERMRAREKRRRHRRALRRKRIAHERRVRAHERDVRRERLAQERRARAERRRQAAARREAKAKAKTPAKPEHTPTTPTTQTQPPAQTAPPAQTTPTQTTSTQPQGLPVPTVP